VNDGGIGLQRSVIYSTSFADFTRQQGDILMRRVLAVCAVAGIA
jgi:hypothetical protein